MVVVFLWWRLCGDVFCGGVFVVVFLWWCSCGAVFVVVWWGFVVVFLWWCGGGSGGVFVVLSMLR